ncbi:hypothetical protein J2S11_004142 [Bacillus horti]|uniref:50S ribosomal protein L36 n=1 Tax=Caldalkalibacillus horti TaxID=77523 RepID=A0ABT9W4M4_9BACI|nr:hypothetical protein [Bacillus horti]
MSRRKRRIVFVKLRPGQVLVAVVKRRHHHR